MTITTCLNCRKPIFRGVVRARGYLFCSERCADDHAGYLADMANIGQGDTE